MADLRSQRLELKKSQLQGSIGLSTSTATASYTTSNVPAVTTVLAYPSKSDAPNITRWSSSEINQFNTVCLNHRIFQLNNAEAWQFVIHSFP